MPLFAVHAHYRRTDFDLQMGPQLHIITILVICMLLAAVLEFVRGFNTQNVFFRPEVAYRK